MGPVFAFGLKPDPLHDPFVVGLKLDQVCGRRDRRHNDARLVAPKRVKAINPKIERRPLYPAEQAGYFLGQRVIDVANETQR
jgi:hypothetical protein